MLSLYFLMTPQIFHTAPSSGTQVWFRLYQPQWQNRVLLIWMVKVFRPDCCLKLLCSSLDHKSLTSFSRTRRRQHVWQSPPGQEKKELLIILLLRAPHTGASCGAAVSLLTGTGCVIGGQAGPSAISGCSRFTAFVTVRWVTGNHQQPLTISRKTNKGRMLGGRSFFTLTFLNLCICSTHSIFP